MAHQWWRKLMIWATGQEFWLNESIATIMVAAWKEHPDSEASIGAPRVYE